MKTPFTPLGTFVLAQPDEAEATTKTGLSLIESSYEKPKTAKVVAVGDETKKTKVGQRVVYRPYSATEIGDYIILEEEDILALVN